MEFPPIPSFSPEHFAVARGTDPSKHKQFRRGIEQLEQEGVVQVLRSDLRGDQAPVLAAVGPMQFEVATHRMATELSAPIALEPLPYQVARIVDPEDAEFMNKQVSAEVLTRSDGVMLVLFRPFTKGDYVEAGGTSGTVTEVGLFQSVLNTPDNRRVIVPNGQITSDNITNYSAYDTRRIDLIIGVGYGDDLKVARSTIEKVLGDHDKVLDEPAPVIWVMELGDSSVNFAVRPWVQAADYWGVRSELLESLKVELEAAGCEIPFPQRDVHVHQVDAD